MKGRDEAAYDYLSSAGGNNEPGRGMWALNSFHLPPSLLNTFVYVIVPGSHFPLVLFDDGLNALLPQTPVQFLHFPLRLKILSLTVSEPIRIFTPVIDPTCAP